MHSQSLASIVNNPKKDSLVKKFGAMVKSKVVGSTEPKFKPLKESQVEDNPGIPKVNAQKDFKDYFRKVSQTSVKTYLTNHPRPELEEFSAVEETKEHKKIKEVDPSAVKRQNSDKDPF